MEAREKKSSTPSKAAKETRNRTGSRESGMKRLEDALKSSEERFNTLVGSLDDVVFTMDLEQRHTGVYGGKLKELNIKPEVFLGRTQREVFGAMLSEVHEAANLRALAGESLNYEWEGYNCETGIAPYFLTSLSPLRDAGGSIIGIVGVVRDISERKQAELTRRLFEFRSEALLKLYMMSFDPIEKILDYALGAGVRLTFSRVGFIVMVDEARAELTVRLASRKAVGDDLVSREPVTCKMEPASLWGEAVRRRAPVILNSFPDGGISEGDIKLTRFMAVPVLDGGEVVAIAAVGNKGGEYDDYDVKELTLIATCAWGIIQRRNAIERLKQSEEYHRTLIENSSDPLLVVDRDGAVRYLSPSVERLYGCTGEEISGEGLFEMIHPEDREKASGLLKRLMDAPDVIHREEIRAIKKNQEIRVFEVMGKKLPAELGSESVAINARDITEIKAVESQLRESESKYHHLFENAGDAIFVADVETGIILEANKQAEILMGRPVSHIIGMHQKDMHPEFDQERCAKGFKMVTSSGSASTTTPYSLYVSNKDRMIPVEISATTFEMGGRKLAQGIFRDITERKRLEEERLEREVQSATRNTQQKLIKLKKLAAQSIGLKEITYKSNKMRSIMQETQKYHMDRSIPILIEGETGTGKEVIVKLIHFGDLDELETPLVDINCAAISPSLFESELFGYEPGSFTGGLPRGRKGKFELAQGGTLFLDEVSEIPLELQAKLLRVIQDKQYYRVGGLKKIQSDVRIICATNQDLEKKVLQGAFRKDLYYRLKVGYIQVPPLRERKEDILPLANMFLLEFSRQRGKGFNFISRDASRMLTGYSWPGNVRELRNLIEWVTFRYDDPVLEPFHIENILAPPSGGDLQEEIQDRFRSGNWVYKGEFTPDFLKRVMDMHKGNKSEVARYLGISRPYLYRLLKDLGES